jgi:LPXTG-motif cell wall-anchored protein
MSRVLVLSVCIAAVVLSSASSAAAQKDPFDPLLEEGTTGTDTGGDTVSSDTTISTDTTDTDTTVAPEPASDEPMPSTGADPSNWIVLAGLAMVLGAGLVVMSRFLEPPAKAVAVRPEALDQT